MGQHQRPFLIAEIGRLGSVGSGDAGRFFDIRDQILPGGGEALIRLRLSSTFQHGFDHSFRRHLLATTIEDLLLKLNDECISLVAELDGELRHDDTGSLSSVALETANGNCPTP